MLLFYVGTALFPYLDFGPKIISSTDRVKKQSGARARASNARHKQNTLYKQNKYVFWPKYRSFKNALAVAETEYSLINGSAVRVANAFDLETVRTGAIRCREGRGGRLTGSSASECQGPAAWFALPPSATAAAADPDAASGRGYRATRWAVCFKEVRYTVSNVINRNKIISLTVNVYPKTKWCRQ